MKKVLKLALAACLALLICLSAFTACNGLSEQQVSDKTDPHVHTFGDWAITSEPTYTNQGLKSRYCSCGEVQTEAIPKKTPVNVILTADNFFDYFNVTYSYYYNEYTNGKVFNYGTIDATLVCVQAVRGDLSNVTVTLDLYPRGGQWDLTNYEEGDRSAVILISAVTGSGTVLKHMGFATTKTLSSSDVREPDTIDMVITSVTGSITLYP